MKHCFLQKLVKKKKKEQNNFIQAEKNNVFIVDYIHFLQWEYTYLCDTTKESKYLL